VGRKCAGKNGGMSGVRTLGGGGATIASSSSDEIARFLPLAGGGAALDLAGDLAGDFADDAEAAPPERDGGKARPEGGGALPEFAC